jgi:signal transduction histidine kinase
VFARDEVRSGVRLTRLHKRLGLCGFVLFAIVGTAMRLPGDLSATAIAGLLIAVAAAVPMFLAPSRLLLGYAAVATAGITLIATVGSGSSNVAWFALCILVFWCVMYAGVVVGLVYWAAIVSVFVAESVLNVGDAGWVSWVAGATFTGLAALLVRHQIVLTERLKQAQNALIEASRIEERNRIARELHDIIAHSLTVSLLHVASARLAIQDDPADAARALAEAERLGRQSLADVRATMGIGRGDRLDEIAPPVPGIRDLAQLVAQMNAAGVPARLDTHGDLDLLPATTAATIYRIVQEALTNTAKHAPGAPVGIVVTAGASCVEVCVDSAGPPGHGSGMGLTSMRERAEAVGGTCVAGPGGNGWLVHALLPLGGRPIIGEKA